MFCKKCGAQVNDGAAFCPGCGTKIAAAPPQNNRQPEAQQPGGPQPNYGRQPYQQPYGQRPPAKSGSGVDLMGIIALGAGALGAILGIAALVKGVRSMTGGGLINSLYNAFTGGSGAGNIVLAIVAVVLSIAAIIVAKKSVEQHGENTFAKLGRVFGIIGVILGAAGLVFSIIGKIRARSASSYVNDLGNMFSDLF